MNKDQERRSGALVAVLLVGWGVGASVARSAARIFLVKDRPPRVPGVPLTPEEAGRIEQEEKRKAVMGAVLLVGSVLGWRLGKALVEKTGKWVLSEASGRGTLAERAVGARADGSPSERGRPAA